MFSFGSNLFIQVIVARRVEESIVANDFETTDKLLEFAATMTRVRKREQSDRDAFFDLLGEAKDKGEVKCLANAEEKQIGCER